MARYTGPKSKIARKFGEPIFGSDKALEHRNYPPGQHGIAHRRKKISEYGTQLKEKQKAKYTYGLLERQFRNLFEKAESSKGVTGEVLLQLLECRLEEPEPMIRIRVVCSKGTYIRALARDIGEALHSGAHLIGLIRTRVGDVRLEDCLDPALFKEWIDGQEIENDEENN